MSEYVGVWEVLSISQRTLLLTGKLLNILVPPMVIFGGGAVDAAVLARQEMG